MGLACSPEVGKRPSKSCRNRCWFVERKLDVHLILQKTLHLIRHKLDGGFKICYFHSNLTCACFSFFWVAKKHHLKKQPCRPGESMAKLPFESPIRQATAAEAQDFEFLTFFTCCNAFGKHRLSMSRGPLVAT